MRECTWAGGAPRPVVHARVTQRLQVGIDHEKRGALTHFMLVASLASREIAMSQITVRGTQA